MIRYGNEREIELIFLKGRGKPGARRILKD